MRITVCIDDDIMERVRALAGRLRVPLKTVFNEALRRGLSEIEKHRKAKGADR